MPLELPAAALSLVTDESAAARPVLINRDPGPRELGVPRTTTVALELVDVGPDGVDRASVRVWVRGVLAFNGSVSPEVQPGFDGARAGVTAEPDTLRIVLDPVLPFDSQALVDVRVAAAVLGGAPPVDQTYAFEVEDRTAPRLVGAQARSSTTVELVFDEPVTIGDPPSGIRVVALDAPAVPLRVVGAVSRGAALEVLVAPEMTPRARYQVSAPGAVDASGNPALPPFDLVVFRGFEPPRPATRRFDLWSMLPQHNRRADVTGDLRRFISCLEEVLGLLLAEVDRFVEIFDLERAPEPFLDLILEDLGNPFRFELDVTDKRRLAAVLVAMYRQKGTAVGIRNAVRFFLDIEMQAIEQLGASALVLGESELGVDWELGPSDRFARYAFLVVVDRRLTDVERERLRAIVHWMKPAHTHFIGIREPRTLPELDHWVLGESEVGLSTVL